MLVTDSQRLPIPAAFVTVTFHQCSDGRRRTTELLTQ